MLSKNSQNEVKGHTNVGHSVLVGLSSPLQLLFSSFT